MFVVPVPGRRQLHEDASEEKSLAKVKTETETNTNIVSISFPSKVMRNILWEYRLNFSGMIEAPANLAEARQLLIEDIRYHPDRYISGLRPVPHTDAMIMDVGKRLLGLK